MTKILINIFLLFSIIIFSACSSTKTVAVIIEPIAFISEVPQKSIKLKAEGIGIDFTSGIKDAEINALRNLFYIGIPKSQNYRPWISEGKIIETKYETFFNQFYNENLYKDFIISSKCVSEYKKNNNTKNVYLVDLEINTFSLRNYLEDKNIIRKLGL